MLDSKNFLPELAWPGSRQTTAKRGLCQVRDYDVPATPEEQVRQRILHWLINTKGWERGTLRLEEAYRWESDPNRSHIRPDIELLDEDSNTLVVVECKREEVPLSKAVDEQAIEYAIKSGAEHIWVTNGGQHRFLARASESRWQEVSSIPPLGEEYEPPTGRVAFPDVADAAAVSGYLDEMGLAPLAGMADEREFTLALYKLLFEVSNKERLPYSHDGVHVLDYTGVAFHQFSNRSGGSYYTRYADFVAATRGRVEAMSVAVNMWDDEAIRLCIGVSKAERRHHALQLDFAKNCEWSEERKCWDVYHDGAMSQVKSEVVLAAVREAGCGHWIDTYDDGKEWAYLGELPGVQSVKWKNSEGSSWPTSCTTASSERTSAKRRRLDEEGVHQAGQLTDKAGEFDERHIVLAVGQLAGLAQPHRSLSYRSGKSADRPGSSAGWAVRAGAGVRD